MSRETKLSVVALALQAVFGAIASMKTFHYSLDAGAKRGDSSNSRSSAAATTILREMLQQQQNMSSGGKKDPQQQQQKQMEQRLVALRSRSFFALIPCDASATLPSNNASVSKLEIIIFFSSVLRAILSFSAGRAIYGGVTGSTALRALASHSLLRALAAAAVFALHLVLHIVAARAKSLLALYSRCCAMRTLLDMLAQPRETQRFANPYQRHVAQTSTATAMLNDALHITSNNQGFVFETIGWMLGTCVASPRLLLGLFPASMLPATTSVSSSSSSFSGFTLLSVESFFRSSRFRELCTFLVTAFLFAQTVNVVPALTSSSSSNNRHRPFTAPSLDSTSVYAAGVAPPEQKLSRWAPLLAEILRQSSVVSDPAVTCDAELTAIHEHLMRRTGLADYFEPQILAASSATGANSPSSSSVSASDLRRAARREAAAAQLAAEIAARAAAESPYNVTATLVSRSDMISKLWPALLASAAATHDAAASAASAASPLLMWMSVAQALSSVWNSSAAAIAAAAKAAPVFLNSDPQARVSAAAATLREGGSVEEAAAVGTVQFQCDSNSKLLGRIVTIESATGTGSGKGAISTTSLDFHLFPGAGLLIAVESSALLDTVVHSVASALEKALLLQSPVSPVSAVAPPAATMRPGQPSNVLQIVPADPLIVPAMCLSDQIAFPRRFKDLTDSTGVSQWDLFQLLLAVGLEHLVENDGDAWNLPVCASSADEGVLNRCDIRLSQTQRQQLAVARVLLRRPRYVVLSNAILGGDKDLLFKATSALKKAGISIVSVVTCAEMENWSVRCAVASVHYSGMFVRAPGCLDKKSKNGCYAAFGLLQNPAPETAPIQLLSNDTASNNNSNNNISESRKKSNEADEFVPQTFLLFSRVLTRN